MKAFAVSDTNKYLIYKMYALFTDSTFYNCFISLTGAIKDVATSPYPTHEKLNYTALDTVYLFIQVTNNAIC